MKKWQWKASKLPVVGCPECISDGKIFIHDEGESKLCLNCKGSGVVFNSFSQTDKVLTSKELKEV